LKIDSPRLFFHSNLIWLLWKTDEGFITEKVLSKKGNTIEDLADVLKTTYPEQRGFSSRSITEKRFCREKGIKRRGIVSNVQLDDAVRDLQSLM
jgi:hypothetical protein